METQEMIESLLTDPLPQNDSETEANDNPITSPTNESTTDDLIESAYKTLQARSNALQQTIWDAGEELQKVKRALAALENLLAGKGPGTNEVIRLFLSTLQRNEQFTLNDVYDFAVAHNWSTRASNPRASMSSRLTRMADIRVVNRGLFKKA